MIQKTRLSLFIPLVNLGLCHFPFLLLGQWLVVSILFLSVLSVKTVNKSIVGFHKLLHIIHNLVSVLRNADSRSLISTICILGRYPIEIVDNIGHIQLVSIRFIGLAINGSLGISANSCHIHFTCFKRSLSAQGVILSIVASQMQAVQQFFRNIIISLQADFVSRAAGFVIQAETVINSVIATLNISTAVGEGSSQIIQCLFVIKNLIIGKLYLAGNRLTIAIHIIAILHLNGNSHIRTLKSILLARVSILKLVICLTIGTCSLSRFLTKKHILQICTISSRGRGISSVNLLAIGRHQIGIASHLLHSYLVVHGSSRTIGSNANHIIIAAGSLHGTHIGLHFEGRHTFLKCFYICIYCVIGFLYPGLL